MVTKNNSAAAIELKALNKRARELMRLIKSGKATATEIKEFSALPLDVGPARGKNLAALIAARNS